MNTFQKTVMITCIILLVIALGILAGLIHLTSQNTTHPPNINSCPDYWDSKIDSQGKQRCQNNSAINHCKNDWPKPSSTHSGAGFCTDPDGLEPDTDIPGIWNDDDIKYNEKDKTDINCMKYIWANYEGVTWDGITNNKTICKDASWL
tara:strand:+ start:19868 stop:20311 length:444 start_codon:yes stop_codon:yes gene_type:complete